VHPKTLLFILVGVVPLVVAGAGVVSFVLLRAGYGLFVGGVVPFVVSLLLAAALGALLGRAASGRRGPQRRRPQDKERGRSLGQDDV
jgi:biotin transporter BioY